MKGSKVFTQEYVSFFLNSRRAQNLSPRTIESYQCHLGRLSAFSALLPTEPEEIEAFLSGLTCQPETKHSYYRTLKTFYRFLEKRYDLPNPVRNVPPPRCKRKVMPTSDAHELMLLLKSATNQRDLALLSLFIDCGPRAGEVANLRKKDIRSEFIRVNGKCGERDIPISRETRSQLLSLAAKKNDDEHVFTGTQGPLTRSGIYRIVRIHMKRAGISGPKLGPHRLRHSFGKGYIVNGGDLRSLKELMGHSTIQTTEKYVSLNLNDLVRKHSQFTPLRTAHQAAQGYLFDPAYAINEAEQILFKSKGANHVEDVEGLPGKLDRG